MTDEAPTKPVPEPLVRKRKRLLGASAKLPQVPDEPTEVVKAVPSARVYAAYYYENKEGVAGFANALLNMFDIRTVNELHTALAAIKQSKPDLEVIEIINWKQLQV